MEKKILIIDDDADIRFTVREICKLRNWRTLQAACYEEAVPIIERERPDLILMDYHMPGLDGLRAIQDIRRTNRNIPIIVLTIEEREVVVNRFFEAGGRRLFRQAHQGAGPGRAHQHAPALPRTAALLRRWRQEHHAAHAARHRRRPALLP